ncbi:DUF454 domain-containing protein [Thalassotalea mangrovi]|uniref:Inner membrane protein n=1 Tax=Thalassotalea mangrovi TaxID=2572245 RepID=A0A4U1B567_9GAMM|nr:DUF454 domain-containing protein [Thalassotalea mangrovi]
MSRYLFLILGLVMVGLATLGAILPGLPTTPFVLVAAACFAKSSPRLHTWLRQNPVFGPLIINWQQHRCVSLRAKVLAVAMIIGFGGYSLFFAITNLWLQITVAIFLGIGLTVVLSLKTCPTSDS